MSVKTGLLGGAFNPPHLAHLALADHAKKFFSLDEVIFIPTRVAAHKTIEGDWDEKTRSLLIRLAVFSDSPEEISRRMKNISGLKKDPSAFLRVYAKEYANKHDPAITVSDIEIDRSDVSYSIDTVNAFLTKEPFRDLFIIIGMDQAEVFDTWKNWRELSQLAHICAANRPGIDEIAMLEKYPFIKTFTVPPMDLSSTAIREKIAKHQSIGADVPKIIMEFLPLVTE